MVVCCLWWSIRLLKPWLTATTPVNIQVTQAHISGMWQRTTMESQVPVHPPGLRVQEQNGASFVQNTLADPKRCKTNFRMSPESFMELHNILVSNHGLQATQEMNTVEGLGMFLWAMGTQRSQRDMVDRFSRALATVSTKFDEVWDAVVSFF